MKHKAKAPGFFLFTQDYFGDVAVRMMPSRLRVFWIEAFFLMSDSPRRGVLLQQNSEPYLPEELAAVLNIPVEIVVEATQYVIEKGIADVDRGTGAIVNRKMKKQSKRSEISSKNGKKGGNPALSRLPATAGNNKDLPDQLNQASKRSHKPRARAFPSPSPTPFGEGNTKEGSLIKHSDPDPDRESVSSRRLFEIYNEYRGGLPEAQALTKERALRCRARITTHSGNGAAFLANFETAVKRAAATPFCRGDTGGWKASFDWFIANDTNYLKVLEGKYEHREPESKSDALVRRSKEATQRINQRILGTTGDSAGGGDLGGATGLLSPRTRRPD